MVAEQARQRYVDALNEVHRAADRPSYEQLARASAGAISKSTAYRLLNGDFQRTPDWNAVRALLNACRDCAPASRPVPPALLEPKLWNRRHIALETALDAAPQPLPVPQSVPAPQPVPAPQAAAALQAYARRVVETYGRLDLEILTPDHDQGEQPVVELREVFVPPSVRVDPPQVELSQELRQRLLEGGELSAEQLPPGIDPDRLAEIRDAYRQRPSEPVLAVLARDDARRAVLLGDPGAGKSTLAHFLALALTGAELDGAEPLAPLVGHVPLVVELRTYAQEEWRQSTFEDFLAHLARTEGLAPPPEILRPLLADGRALVVFDGLDELFDPEVRTATARRIAAFAARYPHCRILVTSRTVGYHRAVLDAAGFTHHMLQDLDDGQITAFARRWYATSCPGRPADAATLVTRLGDALTRSRPVRELAGNPLLLTILAILGRRQTLPRDRHGVYRHAVTVLVARWDRDAKHLTAHLPPAVAETLEVLGQEERLELLRLLARHMQEGRDGISGNHVHERAVEELFRDYLQLCDVAPDRARPAARAMIGQLRERNFILARYGGGVYGFVHRTFLEYLAADDLVHRYEHEREWTPGELVGEVLIPRAGDPSWHEVLLLVAGQLRERDTGALVDGLLRLHRARQKRRGARELGLALRVLAEVKKIAVLADLSNQAIDTVTQYLDQDGWNYGVSPAALAGFGPQWTGRRRYLRWYALWGYEKGDDSIGAVLASALLDDPDAVLGLADTSSPIWFSDVMARVLRLWNAAPGVLDAVVDQVTHHAQHWARYILLVMLARTELDDRGTATVQALLRNRAAHDPDSIVREVAAKLLKEGRAVGSQSLAARGVTDHRSVDSAPGEAALETAVRAWRDGDRKPLCDGMEPLLDDPIIARMPSWRRHHVRNRLDRHPEDRAMVVDAFGSAESVEDRSLAFSLIRVGTDPTDPDLLDLLLDRAAVEPDDELRHEVLDVLGDRPGDARVAALIHGALRYDPAPANRRTALAWFLRRRPDGTDLPELLLERAADDPAPEVRRYARRALGQWWFEDPRCVALFRAPWAVDGTVDDTPDDRWVRFQGLAATGATTEELGDLLAAEPDESVRSRMRRTLTLLGPPRPVTRLALLRRLATGMTLLSSRR
ncbi:NACHT domain-containing protein [Kitasatospora sp. NPDC004272]